jgi:hypothetical protein
MSDSAKRGVQAAAVVVLILAAAGVIAFRGPSTVTASRSGVGKAGLVADYLRRHANDPSSVEIQSIVYASPDRNGGVITQLARVRFREQNAFGAKVFRDVIVTIENNRDVSRGTFEDNFLAIAHTIDWSSDPAGPKSGH